MNRKAIFLIGIVFGLAALGFAGWGQISHLGEQIAGIFSADADRASSETSKLRERDDPEGRADWFMYQRMYPFNKVPDKARKRAWDQVVARGEGLGLEGGGPTWTSIGPMPTAGAGPGGDVSGRINAIAVSPANTQIVLVAGATGGIWRSTNGGTSFAPVTDNQVDLAVGAIAFAPSNANIVYAGMGDNDNSYFGSGVLKSTDAGASWTRINNDTLPDKVQSTAIKVDPANPDRVYVAVFTSLDTSNCPNRFNNCPGILGGIYVSTDGGVNWTRTLIGLGSDVAIHPTNSQIIYAGLRHGTSDSDPRGLFKSTDGGQNWANVYNSPFNAFGDSTRDFRIAVTPADADRVYIYFGDSRSQDRRVEMSTDAGATWTTRGAIGTSDTGLDPGQFGYNTYLVADPTNANTVWVGSRDFFRSTDGGATFTNLNNSFRAPYNCGDCFQEDMQKVHTDQQSFAFMPGNSNTFFVGNDGGIFKTTDGGTTFTSLNTTLSLAQYYSVALHPTDATRSYAGAQDNGSQSRTPGTKRWVEFTQTGDGGKVAINPANPSIIFLGGTQGNILRNTGDGTPNSQVDVANAASFGATQDPARIDFFAPVVANGVDNRLYSGSWQLYICSNCDTSNSPNDSNWNAPSTDDLTKGGDDVLTAIAVAKSNTNVIYTGSRDGRAMRSTDNGASWTEIIAGLPNRSITNITVSANDPALVYLTVSGYGTGHVFKSTDSGTNWTNISNNLPDIPTNAFLIDPQTSTTIYAGTDIGVFRSTDDGGNWTVFNNGLPPVPVTSFSAQTSGRIQISTYGRGVYELSANATNRTRFDLDGDRRTDIGVFRPGPGEWWYLRSSDTTSRAFQFGVGSDQIVPADFTGDGRTDIAFFRPASGEWFVLRSEDNSFFSFPFGADGDIPVPGDYDGDSKADPAVFRPSSATWFINNSGGGTTIRQFGLNGDVPIFADYDGDGRDDLAIFRPNVAEWFYERSSDGQVRGFQFGTNGDQAVPADYTGDSKADIGFFRPSTNEWFILRSEDNSFFAFPFGANGDLPIPGDYDGDGRSDPAVFRPSNNTWFIQQTTAGFTAVQFGIANDIPIPSAYIP